MNKRCADCKELKYFDPMHWRVIFEHEVIPKTGKRVCGDCAQNYYGKSGVTIITA